MQRHGTGVLIMAAGKGTRMKSETAKVLHPVLGTPMIDLLIGNVLSCGADDTAVLVGSGGEQVSEHISLMFPQVRVLWQREQLGTGHAVKCAREWWEKFETLIVLNGDLPLLRSGTLSRLVGSAGDADCAVLSFVTDNPGAYGRVIRSGGGVRIAEYKDASEAERAVREVNAGCYVFRVSALDRVIDRITDDNAQGEYYLPDAVSLIAADGGVTAAIEMPEDEMMGVNTQAELAAATAVMRGRVNSEWMARGVLMTDPSSVWIGPEAELSPGVTLMPNVQIWGRSRIGGGCVIGSGSILSNAVLGSGVRIIANAVIEDSELRDGAKAGPFVYIRENSVLMEGAFAGKFVELKKTTVGRGSKVPHLTYMGDAELGSDVNIGAGTITCNYDGVHKHRTEIGDGCFVGSDTMFVAPVTMGDRAATAAGSVITGDIPCGALGVGRARQRNIEGWRDRNGG